MSATATQIEYDVRCDRCAHYAAWSIARMEDVDQFGRDEWIVRAFACGQHLHAILDRLEWGLDAVMIYDLRRGVERS